MMGSPMPCMLCAGAGRQPCLQCMGTGMEMKPAVVGACDACQGKKAVSPMVNMQNRQAIMMMQNMQMQMQQNIKPMQWGQDKKCGRCGMEWYSFPVASKCPQCNAPKYSM